MATCPEEVGQVAPVINHFRLGICLLTFALFGPIAPFATFTFSRAIRHGSGTITTFTTTSFRPRTVATFAGAVSAFARAIATFATFGIWARTITFATWFNAGSRTTIGIATLQPRHFGPQFAHFSTQLTNDGHQLGIFAAASSGAANFAIARRVRTTSIRPRIGAGVWASVGTCIRPTFAVTWRTFGPRTISVTANFAFPRTIAIATNFAFARTIAVATDFTLTRTIAFLLHGWTFIVCADGVNCIDRS
jgi:hypothetical protein